MSAQSAYTRDTVPQNPALSGARVSFLRVVRSEWRKLWSLRATWILVSIGAFLVLAFAAIGAWGFGSMATSGVDDEYGPLGTSTAMPAALVASIALSGFLFGALMIAVAWAVNLAGEFNQHTIVSTFTAVPTRTPVYLAKALLAAVVGVVAGLALHLAATGVVVLILKACGVGVESSGQLWLDAAISGLYVALLSVLAIGIAALVRNTAGSIMSLIGLVVLVSMVFSILASVMPTVDAWTWLSQHLPLEAVSTLRPVDEANAAMMQANGLNTNTLEAWDAWLTVGFWGLVPLVAGWFSFKTRAVK